VALLLANCERMRVDVLEFCVLIGAIFVISYAQGVAQVYVSERVARDLREQVVSKISRQSFAYVQKTTSSRLLTNLTSDIDAVKIFVSQAIVSIVSSAILLIGASALLLSINVRLALAVLVILPIIAFAFFSDYYEK
jgi:ATP-binding cassette subfamily B protein